MTILLACGSCHDALELAPVQRALAAAGLPQAMAFFGDAAAVAAARQLGLDGITHQRAASDDRSAGADAAAFAADLLGETWRGIVTIGHDPFTVALASAALGHDLPVVHLAAGVRVHRDDGRGNRLRRLADHAATTVCVGSDWQRQELLREGMRPETVHVTGSLLPQACAAFTTAGGTGAPVWLALEHPLSVAQRDCLQALLAGLALLGNRVLAAPQQLAPAVARHALRLPANVELSATAPAAQLTAALQARLIVTDSVGYQQLALALGIPCVVLETAAVLPAAVAAGLATAVDGGNPLLACCQRQLGRGRQAAGAPPDAAAAVVAAIRTAIAPPAEAPAPPLVLPSDGDATGRTLGEDEAILASEAIRRGTLNSTRGTFVTTFEKRFAQWLGRKHAVACASGSAAMHVAIAALQLQPGDEVITTPITDMGALTPILYEGGVPVFADVDPVTLNVTAATVQAQLTARTRAIVVTHLFGLPCDLEALVHLAAARGIPLIEDSAQAFGATWGHRRVGCFGQLAAFSLQQGKHITTGEGGIVATDDDALARRVFLFVNKAWGYGDKKPDHYFPALNYRLTELQGAVATAQLPKLDQIVAARRAVAAGLREGLAGTPGLHLPDDPQGGTHSYWKFAFQVDPEHVPGGAVALGQRMQRAGIACVPRYIQKPAFECELFLDWRRSPVTWLPLQHSARRDTAMPPFHRRDYPGAVRGLEHVVVLPINERYTAAHVEYVARAIRTAVGALQHA